MRIVIAEDEPKSREGLIRLIRRFTDYEIAGVAENGEEGYRMVEKEKPDLVLSDIKMPVLDGLGMLQKIKEADIEVQAVLLTGYSEFEYARRALQLQVVEYVLKPMDIDQFLGVLKKVESRIAKQKAEQVTPERLLWNYISSSEEQREQIRPMLEEKIGVTKDTQFTMLLIHPDSMANESYGEMKEELENQMEALCMENYYMLIRPGEQGGIYIVLVDTVRNRTLKRLFELRILPKIQNITPCVATMDRFVGIMQLPDVMNELSALLKHTFCSGHEVIMTEKMAQMMEYEKLDYPTALENEMVRGIRSGKKDKIAESGETFSKQVILSQATPEYKTYIMQAGNTSVRTDIAEDEDYASQPFMAQAAEFLDVAAFRPQNDQYSTVSTSIQQMVEAVASGDTPENAMKQYATSVANAVGEENTTKQ